MKPTHDYIIFIGQKKIPYLCEPNNNYYIPLLGKYIPASNIIFQIKNTKNN